MNNLIGLFLNDDGGSIEGLDRGCRVNKFSGRSEQIYAATPQTKHGTDLKIT